ncbi:MAG TPA: AsmA family protein [Terriglobia bacterium]|nr:AsmA family protein [Terriglobia bacterium]
MSARGKKIIVILILAAIAVGAALLLLPRLADVDRFRPRVIADLERQTGRSVEIGHLTLAILPALSIRADNVAIGNPPGFPQGHLLEIRRVYADLDFVSLLQRRLVIRSLELDQPAVSLLMNNSGHWNTESPRAVRVQPAGWSENSASPVMVDRVRLNHGRVTYSNLSSPGQAGPASFNAQNLSGEFYDVDIRTLGLNLAPGRAGSLSGGLGDRAQLTPQTARGPRILQIAWSQPSADENHAAVSPHGRLVTRGTISAQSASFGNVEVTGFKSSLELYSSGVRLNGLNIELCGGQVAGDVTWESESRPSRYATHLALSGIDVARLLMALPNARGKLTGTLEGQLDMSGPTPSVGSTTAPGNSFADSAGTGQLTVRNGTLPGLRLNSDMKQLLKNIVRTGSLSADPSSFRSITADLEIAGSEIRSRHITILGNGIEMDVSGALGLDGAGQLDYQGLGKIDVQRNGYSSVLAGLLGSKISGGKISFPFTLTGTLESPRFGIKNSPWLR